MQGLVGSSAFSVIPHKQIIAMSRRVGFFILAILVVACHRDSKLTTLDQEGPAISSDGRFLLFDYINNKEAWIVLYDRSTKDVKRITPSTLACHSPIWAGQSNVFIFS